MFLIKKKILNIPKGFPEIFLIPCLSLVFVSVLSFIKVSYGLIIGAVSLILAIAIAVRFFKTYERPKERLSAEELVLKMRVLDEDRKRVENELAKEREETKKLMARIKGGVFSKRFCPYCRYIVTPDFDFCPKCGKDIKRISKCEKCGTLVSVGEGEIYCPNCGERKT